MRKQFEMTQEEMDAIIKINKEGGDPVMFTSGGQRMGSSLQEKINNYWKGLGEKYGFKHITVQPGGPSNLHFTAITTE